MPTTEAAVKAVFERFHDAVNSRDLHLIEQTIDELVDPGVRFHARTPVDLPGTQALKQIWTMLLRAFPDIEVAVEDVIAEGDKVVARNKVTGTHKGDYRGCPATGKSVTYDEIFIFRVENGRIVEVWGVVDVYTQLQQLGAIRA